MQNTRKRSFERETEYQSLRNFVKSLDERKDAMARLLSRAVAEELTERQALMVVLYYLEQRSMRDIAAELGVNPSTVSRTLQTAREKLKKCLRYCRGLLDFSDIP